MSYFKWSSGFKASYGGKHNKRLEETTNIKQEVGLHIDMITVNGWCAGGKGRCVFSQWGRWGKISVHTSSNRFLKTLTEGAVTTEAGSLFQYFTTLTENADPLLRRRLAPWSTLKGCPLRPRRVGGRKYKVGSISKRSLNILKSVMRSSRSRRRCKECLE